MPNYSMKTYDCSNGDQLREHRITLIIRHTDNLARGNSPFKSNNAHGLVHLYC